MRSITLILVGVLCSSVLVAQTRVAARDEMFGQVTIMSMVTGNINGWPVSGFGFGMLDTTGAFPSTYDVEYDTVPSCIIPLTLLPCQLEAESGALSLWQLSRGQFTCHQIYKWPSYPSDSVYRAIQSTLAGDTLVVHDTLYGQWPDDDGPDIPCYTAHWTQSDSVTVAEECTLGYVRTGGDTLLTTVSSRFTGLRRQLPTPEVSKAYFPTGSFSGNHSSITWWGRTMPENHGRQINVWSTMRGTINGQSLSGRTWGALDTTGAGRAYNYLYFDSLAMPPLLLVLFPLTGLTFNGVPSSSPRVLNLWCLTGGTYDLARTGLFTSDSGDSVTETVSVRRTGTDFRAAIQISGHYSGPTDLTRLQSEQVRWHQLDSTTMVDTGRACIVQSSGDSVETTFRSTFRNLRRPLNFDQTGVALFPQSRTQGECVAYTWTGMLDSASSAVSEPSHVRVVVEPRLWVVPNPANNSSVIRYSLPSAGHATLTLFDATGRLLGTLVQGFMPAGKYSVSLIGLGRKLEGGIYIARLQANGLDKTVKLVLTPRGRLSAKASDRGKRD